MRKLAYLVVLMMVFVLDTGTAAAQIPFSDDFEGDLSQWVGEGGGAHHGIIVEDPLRPGNHVVTFTALNAAGDIFGSEVSVTPGQTLVLSFEYLGNPNLGGSPGNLGGFIGFAEDTPGLHRWLAGTILCCGAEDDPLIDDGQWRTYTIEFDPFASFIPSDNTIRVMLEDFGLSGVAGDVFFDNIQLTSTLPNTPPTASAGGMYSGDEGGPIALSSASASDPDGDPLTFSWSVNSPLCSFTNPNILNPTITCIDNGSYTITLTVDDGANDPVSSSASVSVSNVAPLVDTPTITPESPDEGEAVTASAAFSDPGVNDAPFSCTVDYGDGSEPQAGTVVGNICTGPAHTYADDGDYSITVSVTDKDNGTNSNSALQMVNNVIPVVGPIEGPLDPVAVNTPLDLAAAIHSTVAVDTYTIQWDLGDGFITSNTRPGQLIAAEINYAYTSPGVYTVKLTVTDDDNSSSESTFQFVVVFDSEGGFVTGAGLIDSPAGAYLADPSLTGKATFGFVSKYEKGKTTPSGQTHFRFKMADLDFLSTNYQWLVVAGHKAMFKGTGKINGDGNYGFMLSAIDEKLTPSTDEDLFRIKIWDKDNNDAIIYDNQVECSNGSDDADPCTAIIGGNIVIHQAK